MSVATPKGVLRIGARLPNAFNASQPTSLAAAAHALESAGLHSLWASDHLAMPSDLPRSYPFTSDGHIPWRSDTAWGEAIVALGIAAAVTQRIELGTAVLVSGLRAPLILAKQVATVSTEASG